MLVGVNLLASTNRSVSSLVCSVHSQCVLCGCVLLLRLVVQVCSVARLRLTFHPLHLFYLYITPRKEGLGKHFQGILNSSLQSPFVFTALLPTEPSLSLVQTRPTRVEA